jgi:hypothetical protein
MLVLLVECNKKEEAQDSIFWIGLTIGIWMTFLTTYI